MKTLKEQCEVMLAADRREEIERAAWGGCNEGWKPFDPTEQAFDWFHWDYRVKPRSRTRPFTRADVTDEVRWIRTKQGSGLTARVAGLSDGGIYMWTSCVRWAALAEDHEWSQSINGPWHPFTVEEK